MNELHVKLQVAQKQYYHSTTTLGTYYIEKSYILFMLITFIRRRCKHFFLKHFSCQQHFQDLSGELTVRDERAL